MRSILSISLPAAKKKEIEERAKKANKTVSAYVIKTLELAGDMISEDELLERCKEAEANHKAGKTKRLTSLADLLKENYDH